MINRTRLTVGLAISICAAALLPAGAGAAQRAYVSEIAPPLATPAQIAGFGLDSAGALTPMSPATKSVGSGEGLGGMAITPDAKHLYAIGKGGSLFGFTIGASGALTAVAGTPVAIQPDSVGIAVAPDGKHLYVTSGAASIAGFTIAANGGLSAIAGSPFSVPEAGFGIAIAPDGDHLYYTDQADEDGEVRGMTIAASGALSPIAGSGGLKTIGEDPFAISITPDGNNLYAIERDSPTSNIWVFSLGAGGAMTQVGLPHPVNASSPEPLGSTITPNGKRLYTANADDGTVSGFSIGSGGALTDIGAGAFDVNSPPSARPYVVVPNAAGTRLYANENNADDAYSLSISPTTGALAPLAGSPDTALTSEAQGLVLTPAQPPVAKLTSTPNGATVSFSAAGSTDPDSAISAFAWDFGDGQKLASGAATQSHTYAPGIYTARVSPIDADGCTTSYVSAGQTAFCNGAPTASATVRVDAKPPLLSVAAESPQKVGKTVAVEAGCDEACSFGATGVLKVKLKGKKKTFTLGAASGNATAGATATLALTLSRKAQKAARKGKKPKALITVDASDAAKNSSQGATSVKLKP